ncbi:VPLPA-CTERM sorting domain-containing protein [uncultured Tateyamaria sp.]|uniref:VPLPA-CTERM sorting domain-containing protein n=1 Tax=uncultured Tateyamaria sp. TaxID=455651 RepID=UPI0026150CDC|nr:VPLPA-CTERM sorting domain-containing protein [uncultured Tateyamaria sp.]
MTILTHNFRLLALAASLSLGLGSTAFAASTTVLYDQDFENPNAFIGSRRSDVDAQKVNVNYGNQPAGFTFGNTFTVETINVTDSTNPGGDRQFNSIGGYTGDLAQSGDFVIGMLSTAQDDLLGLTFDVTGFDFLNVQIDLTNLDLECCGAPFHSGSFDTTPDFQFSLFDGQGTGGIGGGTLLDRKVFSPDASARHVIDFSTFTFGLDAKDTTDGLVTLQIDLLSGGYAAFDNLRIAASDTEGNVGVVPLPAAAWFLLAGIGMLAGLRRHAV